jgi:uncharacterized protein Usg
MSDTEKRPSKKSRPNSGEQTDGQTTTNAVNVNPMDGFELTKGNITAEIEKYSWQEIPQLELFQKFLLNQQAFLQTDEGMQGIDMQKYGVMTAVIGGGLSDVDHALQRLIKQKEVEEVKTDGQTATNAVNVNPMDGFELTKENITAEIEKFSWQEIPQLELFGNCLLNQQAFLQTNKGMQGMDMQKYGVMTAVIAVGLSDVDHALQRLIHQKKVEELKLQTSIRVASITEGLEMSLAHTIDLDAFYTQVDDLFGWYQQPETCWKYIGPYFPMIQSSGMGKTRLFVALQQRIRDENEAKIQGKKSLSHCFMILCQFGLNLQEYKEECFQTTIKLGSSDSISEETRNKIVHILNTLTSSISKDDKVILLFDEAQNLLKIEKSFAFRCIRWWLREIDENRPHVVAVFAGTTSALTNFFLEDDVVGKFSRGGHSPNYWNWPGKISPQNVYPPFFRICTNGCLGSLEQKSTAINDFQIAALYGRPLFAFLQSEGRLVQGQILETVLTRMTLDIKVWLKDDKCLYSILGTRIQMGMTASFHFASDLIANGYANLVYFDANEKGGTVGPVSQVAFFPDPVCAALAMGLMSPGWMFCSSQNSMTWEGQEPSFWSRETMRLFSKGLCFPPKGDTGEIMVALYMLFCGDSIRMEKGPQIDFFSVPLLQWYMKMKHPNDEHPNDDYHTDQGLTPVMTVSFIQICRNYFRELRWNDQKSLERMYDSGVGWYMYKSCPAIDLMCAIRSGPKEKYTYHPLLVSVKCWSDFDTGKMESSIFDMFEFLKEIRDSENTHWLKKETKKKGTKKADESEGHDESEGKEKADENKSQKKADEYKGQANAGKGEDLEKADKNKNQEKSDENKRQKKKKNVSCDVHNMDSSKKQLEPKALCLLILIVTDKIGKVPDWYNGDNLGEFPQADAYRVVVVPHDDKFGVHESIRNTTDTQVISEIYTSHACAYSDGSDTPRKRANAVLVGSPPKAAPVTFAETLFVVDYENAKKPKK